MGISTHILDTASGRPASGVAVTLARLEPVAAWVSTTDADGRVKGLLADAGEFLPGIYTLRFDTAGYFAALGVCCLYPYVEIAFEVVAGQAHYHIPLLLTANGYTTYRGS